MVVVSTRQNKTLPDNKALRAEALQRRLKDLAEELNTTVECLAKLGIVAIISISQEGAAPGN